MSNKHDPIIVHGLTVRDQYYEVKLGWSGKFSAMVNGSIVEASTKTGLEETIKRLTKEKHITINFPFCRFDGDVVTRGVATGKHIGNGNIIVKFADENSTQQVTNYNRREYLRKLTAKETVKLEKLSDAYTEAERKLKEFKDSVAIDLFDEVQKLIDAANSEKEDDSA